MISSVVVLPAPFGTEDAEELALLDLERHPVDGPDVCVVFPQILHQDRGRHPHTVSRRAYADDRP